MERNKNKEKMLQNLIEELNRPIKDISQWDFPLSRVLNEYRELIGETHKVNFGKVALALQNVGNAYAKKIDCLHDEVVTVYQENSKKEEDTKRRRGRKSAFKDIDFEDFVKIDFLKEVGKNIDLKGTNAKPVLLNRRIPELERCPNNALFNVDILDVHGAVIGKKYDFRLNQYFSKDGRLVEELKPEDFHTEEEESELRDNVNSLPSELKEIVASSSATLSRKLSNTSFVEGPETSEYFSSSSSAPTPFNSPFNDSICQTPLHVGSLDHNEEFFDAHEETSEENAQSKCLNNEQPNNHDTEDEYVTADEIDAGYTSGDGGSSQDTENHSQKSSSNEKEPETPAKDVNKNVLEPISFTEGGSPAEEVVSQTEFKKPRNTALFAKLAKKKETPKKKREKSPVKQVKKRKLQKEDDGEIPYKKLTLFSPTRSPRKDDALSKARQEFRKVLTMTADSLYEAVTNEDDELLGFQPSLKNEYVTPKKSTVCVSSTPLTPDTPVATSNEPEPEKKSRRLLSFSSLIDDKATTEANNDQETEDFDETGIFESSFAGEMEMGEDEEEEERDNLLEATTSSTQVKDNNLDLNSATNRQLTEDEELARPGCSKDNGEREKIRSFTERKMKMLMKEHEMATELERVVTKWHTDIKPKLAKVEARANFNINQYTSKINDKLKKNKRERLPFNELVRNEPREEIARFFLTTLQSVNSRELEIVPSTGDDKKCSFYIVKLDSQN